MTRAATNGTLPSRFELLRERQWFPADDALGMDAGTYWVTLVGPASDHWWESSSFAQNDDGPSMRLEWDGQLGDADEVSAVACVLGGWLLRVSLRLGEGDRPEVVGMELRAEQGAGSVAVLNDLGLTDVRTTIEAWLDDIEVSRRYLGERWRRPIRRPGRARTDPRVYAVWAARYARAVETNPRSPIKVLLAEEETAGRFGTVDEVRAMVKRARSKGLLTKTDRGKPGGTLTPLGQRLAVQAGEEI